MDHQAGQTVIVATYTELQAIRGPHPAMNGLARMVVLDQAHTTRHVRRPTRGRQSMRSMLPIAFLILGLSWLTTVADIGGQLAFHGDTVRNARYDLNTVKDQHVLGTHYNKFLLDHSVSWRHTGHAR